MLGVDLGLATCKASVSTPALLCFRVEGQAREATLSGAQSWILSLHTGITPWVAQGTGCQGLNLGEPRAGPMPAVSYSRVLPVHSLRVLPTLTFPQFHTLAE